MARRVPRVGGASDLGPSAIEAPGHGQHADLRATGHALGGTVHRYYDPATEQFLSVDPLVDVTGTPYAFTGGDPVNGSDPSGLGILGAILDSLNPISQNNVFYRFGYHHPVAGRVVAGGAALGVAAVGGAACLAGGCEAVGGAAATSGAANESEDSGFFAQIWENCQTFFGDETGSIGSSDSAFARAIKININNPVVANRNLTVQEFISQFRAAIVNRRIPGEFLDQTVEEALLSGNSTVRKLLTSLDSQFTK